MKRSILINIFQIAVCMWFTYMMFVSLRSSYNKDTLKFFCSILSLITFFSFLVFLIIKLVKGLIHK